MSLTLFKIQQIDYSQLENKKLSIVLTTFRKDPKFNILFKSLSQQTFKNFELVIADYEYELHKDTVKSLSIKYGIDTNHIKRDSIENIHGLNLGIINSNGDYMIHINDCSYYPYRWAEKHMFVCTKNFLSLGSRYFTYSLDFPIEKYLTGEVEIPIPQDQETSKLIEEYSHGIKEYLCINFGEHTITSPQDFRLLGIPPKFFFEENFLLEAMPGWAYGGNTCAPTEAFLELNGFDEEYDKGFGWADCDFGIRAFNKGYKSFINLSNWCLEIQDKSHNISPDSREHADHNWKLYEKACDQKITRINDNFNLREMRKEILERKNIKEE